MANENLEDAMGIFGMSVDDVDLYDETKESVLYKPTADAGNDGIYRSLIRFIPNPKNPKKSITRKFVYWLEDADGNGSYYDSPSTVGESCPVQDLFFKLRNSESAIDKKNSEKLKRREIFYSIVQIVKDPQKPDLEGKLKVFKYGWKIKQKIDEELKPKFDEPVQIFDPFEGKNFELTITKQGGFNNYDSSKFSSKISPMMINGKPVESTSEGKRAILEYVSDAPTLVDFEYRPWDDETRGKIEEILNQFRSPGKAYDTVTSQSDDHTDIDSSTFDDDTEDLLKDIEASTPISSEITEEVKDTLEESSDESEDENFNNLLKDLDIE